MVSRAPRWVSLRHSLAVFLGLGLAGASSCRPEPDTGPVWLRLAEGHQPAPVGALLRQWDLGPRRAVAQRPDGSIWFEHRIAAEDWRPTGLPGEWGILRPDIGGAVVLDETDKLELRLDGQRLPRQRNRPGQEHTSFRADWQRLLIQLPAGKPGVEGEAVFAGHITRGTSMDGVWRVPLGRLVADGIPVWSGERFERVVDVPADSCLRFDTAALGLTEGQVTLRVSLDGRALFEDIMLLEGRLDTVQHEIELGSAPIRGARLVFEVVGTPALVAFLRPVLGPLEVGTPGARPWGPSRPNLVLFVADTLRADLLEEWGGDARDMPFLNDLARRSLRLLEARSTSTWTLPAHASMFTGLYPTQHGVNTSQHAFSPELHTLAELLRDSGYRTAAITDAGYMSRAYGLDQGFERFEEYRPSTREKNLRWVLDHAASELERDDGRPLFLFVHTFRVHQPYRVGDEEDDGPRLALTESYKALRGPRKTMEARMQAAKEFAAQGRALYVEGARALDRGLARWFPRLESGGWLDPGYFLFTSDHGEAFFEHGWPGHKNRPYGELARVPIVLHGPGLEPRAVSLGASLIDIPPTVAALLGLERSPDWEGESLLDLDEQRLLFSMMSGREQLEVAVLRGDHKLLVDFSHDGGAPRAAEAYDLSADESEKRNLLGDGPPWTGALLEEGLARWSEIATSFVPSAEPHMGEAGRRALEHLGYAGD